MTSTKFSALPISKSILHNLEGIGLKQMTPIQSQALPHILKNRDVIAQAKTGSGKTAAFGIGLLNRLNRKNFRVQSIVICPTRELADQVAKELRRLARLTDNVKILTLSGGVPFGPQQGSLRHGAHVVVGTPGRILKHIAKNSLTLDTLETLVLDEADRMLDMGFIEEISKIISHTPERRQTLLFSATYPEEIMELSNTIQKSAIHIHTTSSEKANPITEYFYEVSPDNKGSALIQLLSHHKPDSAIIFSNTKIKTETIANTLRNKGIAAMALHGDLEQYQRTDVLVQFSNHSCSVLIATDVAARGLDIKELGMVVNYDLPHDEETYIHRIGRTGRAGSEGVATTLFTPSEAMKADTYNNTNRLFENIKTSSGTDVTSLTSKNLTLMVNGGKKEKIRPGDLLGALTGEAGIAGSSVGKIDIHDHQSYVAIARDSIDKACSRLKNGKIKGRKFSVRILPQA
ncbi:MAG: ATP-dependent RNA helicase DbpA [Gammaproteobacteria bacterium]|uniref:ATP-dependent RNA helicase DbpA n=1 Tax=Candidatus Thiopontia autotrophica TaxID=2841688 RepID=A0A8J6P874_9GAMM|nr:ATP-dependent RNA helicase DbpA [Candidatus Thiopontia autotrophica]